MLDASRAFAEALAAVVAGSDALPLWLRAAWGALLGGIGAGLAGVIVARTPPWFGLAPARPARSLWERSRCDGCGRPLPVHAVLPVFGRLLVRGRCGACGYRVPLRHAVLELGAALGGGLAAGLLPPSDALWWLAWQSALLATAWFDWQEEAVPDLFAAVLAALGLLAPGRSWLDGVVGAAAGSVTVALALASVHRSGTEVPFGWGDVVLGGALGVALGWDRLPWFLGLAALAHGTAFALTARGRAALAVGRPLPMAPSLCLGAAIAFWLPPPTALT